MWKIKLLLLLPVSLLASCANPGAATDAAPEVITQTRVVDNSCSWVKPIWVSKSDVLSDGTADQIRVHNETGAKRCGWKPRAK
ncbi:hypothetical protein C7R54_15745 [Achromobacter aloeverae]|uniref:Uncharacterized protein n=1 Tax=Achromobacter aloeverae TaxID=1750518 RepID=A0A4Q1HIK0_9BURK|nr:hypothetical protein C7R54_15745 [Achromobacter aloeverae]